MIVDQRQPLGEVLIGDRDLLEHLARRERHNAPDVWEAPVRGHEGRPVAAIIPVDEFAGRSPQRSLLPWKATGRGLWRKRDTRALRDLRDEWSR